MPHSVTSESTAAEGQPTIKPEPDTQDIAMDDAPSAGEAGDRAKENLEQLFDDDEDSDGEFASSAPVKSEEEASQPAATLYACNRCSRQILTDTLQQDLG